jgi:hypothetical protein
MEILIKQEVSREILENVFITALEGGSNYWYHLGKDAINIVRSHVSKEEEMYLAVAIFKAVYDKGAMVPVRDAENEDDVIGYLSKETFKYRLQKMVDDNYGEVIMSEIKEEGDAGTSDLIFQYLVLGEIVYG